MPIKDSSLEHARQRRQQAAENYRPDHLKILLVAEAPPAADDRYFYFLNVSSQDHLFLNVCDVVLGKRPSRNDKSDALAELKNSGIYLIDLKPDPVDGSKLSNYVADLIRRCKELEPSNIILIKATVFDVAYTALHDAGLPVANHRIYFPSCGRQNDFRMQFRAALDDISS